MNKEMYEDEEEREEGGFHHMMHMSGPMKKEFKIAMLEKKEKIMKAKLEFIGKMKSMVGNMPDDEEDDDE